MDPPRPGGERPPGPSHPSPCLARGLLQLGMLKTPGRAVRPPCSRRTESPARYYLGKKQGQGRDRQGAASRLPLTVAALTTFLAEVRTPADRPHLWPSHAQTPTPVPAGPL